MRMSSYTLDLNNTLTVYGSYEVEKFFNRAFELEGYAEEKRVRFQRLEPFKAYEIGNYTIHVLPARHGYNKGDSFIYLIIRDGKSFLYTLDTGYPNEEVFEYLQANQLHIDIIALDCTAQIKPTGGGHMNLEQNLKLIEQLKSLSLCDENSLFVTTHFSHNGGLTHSEMETLATKHGLLTAYDGMII
jgi:phosphoribosyl 1,2-cyclic phosphate phosphodiesterase